MASFKGYVRSQRRPQATGNETPFFVFLRVWGGVEDVNVPVNLLTSCMLRETSGFGWGGGDGNVPVNFGVAWVIYIYIFTILHNESHIQIHIYIYVHTYTFIFIIVYIQM